MNKEQAFQNLVAATNRVTGTKEEHLAWEQSLQIISKELFETKEYADKPKWEEEKKEEKPKK